MQYQIAWAIYAVGAAGFLFGVWRLALRRIPAPGGELLLALLAATIAVPAEGGGSESFYAPAFVVAFFEAFLQRGGDPRPALGVLGAGWTIAVLAVLWHRLRVRRRART